MKNISLSIVYENSQKRASGYMEEALRLGKVVSSWLEISDDNYQDLENRFALGEKRKVQQEVVQQEVVQQEVVQQEVVQQEVVQQEVVQQEVVQQEVVQQEVVQQEVVQQEVVQQAHVAPNNRQNRARGN